MKEDEQISADLAIVARTSRAHPRALATTLARLGARPEAAAPNGYGSSIAVAPAYARRLASVIAGGYVLLALLAIFVPLAALRVDAHDLEYSGTLFVQFYNRSYTDIAIPLAASAIIVYFVAWSIGLRVCERRLRQNARTVPGLQRSSLFMAIAAPLAFVMAFGLVRVSIASEALLWLITPDGFVDYPEVWWRHYQSYVQLSIVVALFLVIAGAAFVSRLRWKVRPVIVLAATIAFAAVVLVGLRFDAPAQAQYTVFGPEIDYGLRTGLVAFGFVSLSVLIWAFASALRRRELAALDGK